MRHDVCAVEVKDGGTGLPNTSGAQQTMSESQGLVTDFLILLGFDADLI